LVFNGHFSVLLRNSLLMARNTRKPIDRPFSSERWFQQIRDDLAWLSLFDYLPGVYLYVKDAEHRFTWCNRWLAQLMTATDDSTLVLGKTDYDFHPPTLAALYVEEDKKVMLAGAPLPNQAWLVLGVDGLPHWYLSSKVPLFNRRDTVIGIAGVMRPYQQAGEAPGDYHRLTPALEHVLHGYGGVVTVEAMAEKASLSVSQFQRQFIKLFGMTPGDYLLRVRVLMARRLLEQTGDSLGVITEKTGFYDQSHLSRSFRQQLGLSPSEYRRRFSPQHSKISLA
jgi:AraC-like DNA-binding protein